MHIESASSAKKWMPTSSIDSGRSMSCKNLECGRRMFILKHLIVLFLVTSLEIVAVNDDRSIDCESACETPHTKTWILMLMSAMAFKKSHKSIRRPLMRHSSELIDPLRYIILSLSKTFMDTVFRCCPPIFKSFLKSPILIVSNLVMYGQLKTVTFKSIILHNFLNTALHSGQIENDFKF